MLKTQKQANNFFASIYLSIIVTTANGQQSATCNMLFNSEVNYTNPATQQLCASLSSDLLNRIDTIGRCHIVDFAETSLFYVSNNVGKGQNLRGYLGPLVGINFYTTKITTLKSVFNHNTYSLPCSALKFYK